MPDRCESRCSMVTSSPISGRSSPSTERAVVVSSRAPSWISRTTVSAVNPLPPLAIPNWVSSVFGIWWRRSASPYAFWNSTAPATVDPNDAGEPGFGCQRVDCCLE